MNDNEIGFRIRISLYIQKFKGPSGPNFHYLTDLLSKSGIPSSDARQAQIAIERISNTRNVISFVKTASGNHYLEDIELMPEGIGSVENLLANTISDPSPLKLSDDEKSEWDDIVKEVDKANQMKKFNDFILSKKHHFFETDLF